MAQQFWLAVQRLLPLEEREVRYSRPVSADEVAEMITLTARSER